MAAWKDKIILNDGEVLRHDRPFSQGFVQEEDVDLYSIVNAIGTTTGKIQVTDHTAVKGFRRTVRVLQTDSAGKVIIDEKWTQ
ncbi:hypothetical protein V4C53_14430 [Paraburkholderia azotifigens]|uniref:hypothetical protein n=1 Tax=Paraburkholderia azotifigens TaxID=2057004 RepID=UPI00316F15EC